jgi:inhibitor of cysteine peptidase
MRWKLVALALSLITTITAIAIGYTMNRGENVVTGTGTIVWLDLEGGFWGIIGDDGEHYDPINLDSDFQDEDLRVYFEAKIRTDLGSFHMWGKIVEILKIQKL